MIVVASNDNESPQVTLPGFSICVRVPVCYTAVFSVVTHAVFSVVTGEERCVTALKMAVQQTIPVQAIQGLTHFLTMAEVTETAKTA